MTTTLKGIPEIWFGRLHYVFTHEGETLASETQNEMTLDEFNLQMIYLNELEERWLASMNTEGTNQGINHESI